MSSGTPKKKHQRIQYVGVSALSPEEQDTVNTLTTEYYEKIKRSLHNETNLVVHVKLHNAEGNRRKYSMHVRAQAPTKQQFESCNADDWDLPRTLHKAFTD